MVPRLHQASPNKLRLVFDAVVFPKENRETAKEGQCLAYPKESMDDGGARPINLSFGVHPLFLSSLFFHLSLSLSLALAYAYETGCLLVGVVNVSKIYK